MKIVLDAQISGRGVAEQLREQGHDVLAVVDRHDLDGATDEDLLRLAGVEERVVVTFNVRDFAPLVARYTATEGGHRGCVLVSTKTFAPNEFGRIARALLALFMELPDPGDWQDKVVWLSSR